MSLVLTARVVGEKATEHTAPDPGVAQMVACLVRDQEAVGSNPATRTTQTQNT